MKLLPGGLCDEDSHGVRQVPVDVGLEVGQLVIVESPVVDYLHLPEEGRLAGTIGACKQRNYQTSQAYISMAFDRVKDLSVCHMSFILFVCLFVC